MRILALEVGLAIAGLATRTGWAQPAPAPSAPSQGAGDAASEPVFGPERVTSTKPPAEPSEPITVDRIVIASTERIDLNFFGDVSLLKLSHEDPAFSIGPL